MVKKREKEQFALWVMESYKTKHQLSGMETLDLFLKFNALDYLISFYNTLSCESIENNVLDIEEFISSQIEE